VFWAYDRVGSIPAIPTENESDFGSRGLVAQTRLISRWR